MRLLTVRQFSSVCINDQTMLVERDINASLALVTIEIPKLDAANCEHLEQDGRGVANYRALHLSLPMLGVSWEMYQARSTMAFGRSFVTAAGHFQISAKGIRSAPYHNTSNRASASSFGNNCASCCTGNTTFRIASKTST